MMPALVQKPARAQMNDSRCRSAGLRPNSVTVIGGQQKQADGQRFDVEALCQDPEYRAAGGAAHVHPDQHAGRRRGSEAQVDDDFRDPLRDEVEGRDVEEVRQRHDGRDGRRVPAQRCGRPIVSAKLDGIAGSAVTARCPIRLRATLIRSSAPAGCFRASQ